MKLGSSVSGILVGLVAACSSAPPPPNAADGTVVPGHERDIARSIAAEGPTETRGIESAETLGSISLEDEFPGLKGRVLRAREVTVLPGARSRYTSMNGGPAWPTCSRAS